jgi:membrane fusion protein (multidrug efflux system)
MTEIEQQGSPTQSKPVRSSRVERLPRSKKKLFVSVAIVGALGIAIVAWHWWQDFSAHESTDDAYVVAHIHNISARIAGTVTQVSVDENQSVKAGQLLAKLDSRDYAVQVEQARAALRLAQQQAHAATVSIPEAAANAQAKTAQATGNIGSAQSSIAQAQAGVSEARAGVENARAGIAQAEANLVKAQQDYQRYRLLVSQGAISMQQFDQATATLRAAIAQRDASKDTLAAAQHRVSAAQATVSQARANLVASRGQTSEAQAGRVAVDVARAQAETAGVGIEQAIAKLHEAELALSYTTITTPVSGVTGKRQVEVGQRVQPGQAIFSVVERAPWIDANFKETQLGRMRVGQPVEIEIDGIPGKRFTGRVASISPASGAQFALLPPENATGNFTKIVQRVPVRVEFDKRSIKEYQNRIVAGMSTIVRVRVN